MALIDSLISYWKFDDNYIDSVGNKHVSVVGSSTFQAGKINNSAQINDASSILLPANNNTADIQSNTISFSLWANFNASLGNYQGLFVKQFAWGLFLNSTIGLYDWANGVFRNSGVVPPAGFNHYAVTLSLGVTNGAKIYLNGNLILTTTIILNHQGVGLAIGNGNVSGASQGALAKIDEVALWNRVLSASEVLDLYNNNSALNYPFNKNNSGFFNFI